MFILCGDRKRAFELYICLLLYFSCDNVFSAQLAALGNYLRYAVLIFWLLKAFHMTHQLYSNKTITCCFLIGTLPSLLFTQYSSPCIVKIASMAFMLIAVYMVFSAGCYTADDLYLALVGWGITYTLLSLLLVGSSLGYHNTGAFHGLSGNRNPFGTAMVISSVLMLSRLRTVESILKKLFYMAMFILTVVFVFMSESRGALLGLVIAIGIYQFLIIKKKSNVIFTWIGIAGLIRVFGNQLSSLKVIEALLTEGVSRNSLWDIGIAEFKKYPVFGAGFGVSYLNNIYDTDVGAYNYHNAYLSILTDVGIWGAICFCVMFGYVLINCWRQVRYSTREELIVGLVIVLSFFAQAWGESFLLAAGNPLCLICWMSIISIMTYEWEEIV